MFSLPNSAVMKSDAVMLRPSGSTPSRMEEEPAMEPEEKKKERGLADLMENVCKAGSESAVALCAPDRVGELRMAERFSQADEVEFSPVPVGVIHNGDDYALAPLEKADGTALGAVKPAPVCQCDNDVLVALNGRWFLESNDKAICDVWNSEVYFDPDTSLKDTLHYLRVEASTLVSLKMNGQTYLGDVTLDAQARIIWRHGEVWIRK